MVHIVCILYCHHIIMDNPYLLWTDNVVYISNYVNIACNDDIDCNSSLLVMLISSTDCWEPASTTVLLLL